MLHRLQATAACCGRQRAGCTFTPLRIGASAAPGCALSRPKWTVGEHRCVPSAFSEEGPYGRGLATASRGTARCHIITRGR